MIPTQAHEQAAEAATATLNPLVSQFFDFTVTYRLACHRAKTLNPNIEWTYLLNLENYDDQSAPSRYLWVTMSTEDDPGFVNLHAHVAKSGLDISELKVPVDASLEPKLRSVFEVFSTAVAKTAPPKMLAAEYGRPVFKSRHTWGYTGPSFTRHEDPESSDWSQVAYVAEANGLLATAVSKDLGRTWVASVNCPLLPEEHRFLRYGSYYRPDSALEALEGWLDLGAEKTAAILATGYTRNKVPAESPKMSKRERQSLGTLG